MMKRLGTVLAAAVLVSCSVLPPKPPLPKPPVPQPPTSSTLSFDIVACRTPFVDNYCDGMAGAVFKIHTGTNPDTYATFNGDNNGYAWATGIPDVPDSDITISAPAYVTQNWHISPPILVATNAKGIHNVWQMAPAHVDPSTIPLQTIAAVRGAMWPQGAPCGRGLPIGPRPNQPDNIIATDFFHNYSVEDQKCVLDWENANGYTHVVVGPLVDSDGYHGMYRPTDWRQHWDEFLDIHQQFYDNKPADGSRAFGQIPITFITPDGWSLEQAKSELTPYLRLPRSQKLIKFAVVAWEPTRYGWSSCTWAGFVGWLHTELPNAVIAIHTVADVDAPVGTDALCDDNGKPNGLGWQRVVDAGLHVWLVQNGAYETAPAANPQLARDFCGQFDPGTLGVETHGAAWHFATGAVQWPTNSAWGPNHPLQMVNAEVTSYTAFWHSISEPDRQAWGDLAVGTCHATGYLDGGTVPVPVVEFRRR